MTDSTALARPNRFWTTLRRRAEPDPCRRACRHAVGRPLALDDAPQDGHRDRDHQHQRVENRQRFPEQQLVQPRQHRNVQLGGEESAAAPNILWTSASISASRPSTKALLTASTPSSQERHDAQQLGEPLLEEVRGRAGVAQLLGAGLDLLPLAGEVAVSAQARDEAAEEGR